MHLWLGLRHSSLFAWNECVFLKMFFNSIQNVCALLHRRRGIAITSAFGKEIYRDVWFLWGIKHLLCNVNINNNTYLCDIIYWEILASAIF
jgi:hypothetical protein